MEEEFDYAGSIADKMPLQIRDGTIPVSPDCLFVEHRARQPFAVEDLWMNARDQNLLIVGSVEDTYASTFRQIAGSTPEKIVLQFGTTGMFEAQHLAALRINSHITCLMTPSLPAAS